MALVDYATKERQCFGNVVICSSIKGKLIRLVEIIKS
jgi:hypothetical protein